MIKASPGMRIATVDASGTATSLKLSSRAVPVPVFMMLSAVSCFDVSTNGSASYKPHPELVSPLMLIRPDLLPSWYESSMNMFAVVGRSTQKVNSMNSAPRTDGKPCEIDASSIVKTYHDPSWAVAEPLLHGRIPVIAVLVHALMSESSKLGFRITVAAGHNSPSNTRVAMAMILGIGNFLKRLGVAPATGSAPPIQVEVCRYPPASTQGG